MSIGNPQYSRTTWAAGKTAGSYRAPICPQKSNSLCATSAVIEALFCSLSLYPHCRLVQTSCEPVKSYDCRIFISACSKAHTHWRRALNVAPPTSKARSSKMALHFCSERPDDQFYTDFGNLNKFEDEVWKVQRLTGISLLWSQSYHRKLSLPFSHQPFGRLCSILFSFLVSPEQVRNPGGRLM